MWPPIAKRTGEPGWEEGSRSSRKPCQKLLRKEFLELPERETLGKEIPKEGSTGGLLAGVETTSMWLTGLSIRDPCTRLVSHQ